MNTPTSPPSAGLNISLWVVQVLLALAFGMAGVLKLGTPTEELVTMGMAWAERVPGWMRFLIGGSELAGAIGLVLPAALRVLPRLTGAAAVGLVVVMVLAAGEHARAAEFGSIPVNVVLGGLAAFVAWGRLAGSPIKPR